MPPDALRHAIARDLTPLDRARTASRDECCGWRHLPSCCSSSLRRFSAYAATPARLGFVLSWGVSFLETLLGLGIVAMALREAVPGTMVSRRAVSLVWALAIGTVIAVTMVTWRVSPTPLLQQGLGFVWRVCVAGTFVSALPRAGARIAADPARVSASPGAGWGLVRTRFRPAGRFRLAHVLPFHRSRATCSVRTSLAIAPGHRGRRPAGQTRIGVERCGGALRERNRGTSAAVLSSSTHTLRGEKHVSRSRLTLLQGTVDMLVLRALARAAARPRLHHLALGEGHDRRACSRSRMRRSTRRSTASRHGAGWRRNGARRKTTAGRSSTR